MDVQKLRESLRQVTGQAASSSVLQTVFQNVELFSELQSWVRKHIARCHLVQVACALHHELNASPAELSQLGLPVDVLADFPAWQSGSAEGFHPQQLGLHPPLIGAAHPMRLLRLQLSPFSTTLSAALLLLKRLLEGLGPTTHFLVAVEPGGNLEALHELIAEFTPTAGRQVSLFEIQTSSLFAQDNARGARNAAGDPLLFIPRTFRDDRERNRDDLGQQSLEEKISLPIQRSRLYWEGGNIVSDDRHCFVGVDTVYENMTRLGLTYAEVRRLFQSEFGHSVEFLGELGAAHASPGDLKSYQTGQASFHVDLDLCLPGAISQESAPIALVADPSLALPILPSVLNERELTTDHFWNESQVKKQLHFEYTSFSEERSGPLKAYCSTLQSLGYIVKRVPDLRIDPSDNLFSTRNLDFIYCNALPALHDGKPAIFYLPYGIADLDKLAESCFQEAGLRPQRVGKSGRLANLLMRFNGGLRCACSQVY